MSITWITPPGDLGTIPERIIAEIPLEATSAEGNVVFSVIAGSLPSGMRIDQTLIKGSPVEVETFTVSRFVIRASDGVSIKDRTFSISVDGSDSPEWITDEGAIQVGSGENYFVLDNSWVDFQLEAVDTDLTAGDILEYYLAPRGGQLPPGLTRSKDGRIFGFTDPIFTIDYQDQTGAYDTTGYDIPPLDVYQAESNGFDSFFYDTFTFDYNEPSETPKRLSRLYSFVVWVADKINPPVERLFSIWVVTEEFLKADNNVVQVDTNLFRADNDDNRIPYWITESYLGRLRANNYVTIYLDVYDPPSLPGSIAYFLLPTNSGRYQLNNTDQVVEGRYEISGEQPIFSYELIGSWDNTKTYKVGEAVTFLKVTPLFSATDTWVCIKENTNVLPSESTYWTRQFVNTRIQTFITPNTSLWTSLTPETSSTIPPGLELDTLTGELAGRVPYQPAITETYRFTMQAISFPTTLQSINYTLVGNWNSSTEYTANQAVRYKEFIYIALYANQGVIPSNDAGTWELAVSTAEKTFSVDMIGEIESNISWISDSDIGTINPNQPSELFVKAETTYTGGAVVYELESGSLPPGLTLLSSGLIQGKVTQFADSSNKGLTRFFDSAASEENKFNIIFDNQDTSFDQKFSFKIKARDTAGFTETLKDFSITVLSESTIVYSNLYLKAYQTKEKRLQWYDFITNFEIFRNEDIYRPGDQNFGVQTEIKVLLYAGIESTEAVKYVQAMSRNHYKKQLRFGDVKSAVAKDPVTQQVVYEAVYVEIVDEYEKNGKSISRSIELSNKIESKVLVSYDKITIDSDIPFVSDSDYQRVFPNSFKNMRSRMKGVGVRNREFLPLWMRSVQPNNQVETGFVKALVLCYAQPGAAERIISRIKADNFDFKLINFTADRYIIDVIDGEIQDQFLPFPQRNVLNKY